MRRLGFVPSQRLINSVFALAGALAVGLLVLLISLYMRTADRLDASETTTAALAEQLRQMGVEPEVEVDDDGAAVVRGPRGATGPAGPQGQTGRTGPRGFIGPVGPSGPLGLRGRTGAQGETGATGDAGQSGATGQTGPAGPQGPQGERGEQGPRGETGPAGPAGAPGVDGQPGPSCPQGSTPQERTVITAENPLGEPAIVCVPEASP